MELREQIFDHLSRTGEKRKHLAKRAGVDPSTITRILQGVQTNLTTNTVRKIQGALESVHAATLTSSAPGCKG